MTDSIDSHIESKMSESDWSKTVIAQNIGAQGNVDTKVILYGKSKMRTVQELLKMKLGRIIQKISINMIRLLICQLH